MIFCDLQTAFPSHPLGFSFNTGEWVSGEVTTGWVGIRAFKKALWCGQLKAQQMSRKQLKIQGHLQLRTQIKLKGLARRTKKKERDKRGRVSFFMGFWLDQSRDVMMSFFYHPFDLFLLSIWALNSLLWFLEHIQAIYKLIAYKVGGMVMRMIDAFFFFWVYLCVCHRVKELQECSCVCQRETAELISPDLVNIHSVDILILLFSS